jgi:cellulose synthase/poly-beta-1,6-N-acetylglucosamine synthase-like glycosyltransferase
MTLRTPVIETVLTLFSVGDSIRIKGDRSIQVIASLEDLQTCKRHQNAAFVKDLGLLVVWDDEPQNIIARAGELERSIVEYTWNSGDENTDKQAWRIGEGVASDVEAGTDSRPTVLWNAYTIGLTLALLTTTLALGWKRMAYACTVENSYWRLGLLIFVPAQFWLSIFFMNSLVNNILQFLGPSALLNSNSKFYSAKPPRRLNGDLGTLPHVTIQMPVYKEGLENVIMPTIKSLKEAICTYEQQGGSANIFVNDDGLQLISEDLVLARKEFYAENGIGWVARPAHNPNPNNEPNKGEHFLRRGKFKKASNMNYALMISSKIEEKLAKVERGPQWTQHDEQAQYNMCMNELMEENPRAWTAGNIRMGDYILLVDSDTRIPSDCLLDAASEMEQDQEVGIIQFSSGVLLVSKNNSFEKGYVIWKASLSILLIHCRVKFFTDLVYTAIRYCVALGDLSPFVGHNAIIRWAAMQQVSYKDEDGYEKFWSESHVSEDFDMSLRLQCNGYLIRLGSYFGDGFKEGVSLTVYDELNRWEKYAYGCNELLFHPLKYWLFRGPFTPLFKKWLFSPIRLASKVGVLGYIGTYYAIGAAWILTLANYFLIGWVGGHLDQYYLNSFKIILSLLVVFTGLGNFALAWIRYRIGEGGIISGCKC